MKIKKYTAPTMPEAMKKIRKELGTDAVILDSKVIYLGGVLGFFKKKNIQVIAALDPQPALHGKRENARQEKKGEVPILQPQQKLESINQDVLEELKEMKRWLEKNTNAEVPSYPLALQLFYHYMVERDVKKEYVMEWLDELKDRLVDKDALSVSKKEMVHLFQEYLENRLKDFKFHGIDYQKKYVHLAGPTGVGKTTTIAKLAANSLLQDKKRVALITTDTYRIAAIDQLRTYAKILDIPLEVAYSHSDYEQAKDKFRDYDLVLIDTAGRNFRNSHYVKEFSTMVNVDDECEIYLVLSLTSKFNDQEEIYQQFAHLPIKQFIFTKEDETTCCGSILNLMLLSGKGIAYITNGQEVPDDIEETSIKKVNQLIVGDYAND